jgi:hypothetical protein
VQFIMLGACKASQNSQLNIPIFIRMPFERYLINFTAPEALYMMSNIAQRASV